MDDLLHRTYLGNVPSQYLTALGILLGTWLGVLVLKKGLLSRLERWAASTETTLDDFLVLVIKRTLLPVLYVGAVRLALAGLALHASLQKLVSLVWMALFTFFGVRFLLQVIRYFLVDQWGKDRPGPAQAARALLPVLKAMVWTVGLIFFLDNAGVKISAAVAGLGIGGVAVALAAQAVLGDLFSYVAILFDRPFALGDFIVVDSLMGTVEQIGIKTTRLRSLSGELLVFPNSSLTGSRIRNYQHMNRRRVVFSVGLVYETSSEKLREVPALLKEAVKRASGTTLDRAHFASMGESSLNFEVVYFVESADYNKFMDIQQEINFALKDEFERRGLSFAYPTRTVYSVSAK